MMIEVHAGGKPAVPYRAWVASVVLLFGVSGLALTLIFDRTGRFLQDRVSPAGWHISFQPAKAFELVGPESDVSSGVRRYRLVSQRGGIAELAFWRVDARDGLNAVEVCDQVLQRTHLSWLRAFFPDPAPIASVEALGGIRSDQILDPTIPMVVRAVVLNGGWAYAVSLRVEGASMGQRLYRTFEATCQTIEYATP